ncbi:zinc ribbon domain-containing protein [Okeania sp. SIO3I5]|nr:zinc ribbon domain-containing protein [Okeania sp. SIO3I5]
MVDRWFPSSKTCSNCETVKEYLLLSERVFNCEHCNFSCDIKSV